MVMPTRKWSVALVLFVVELLCHRALFVDAACTLRTFPVAWVVAPGGSMSVTVESLVSDTTTLTFCTKAPVTVTPSTYSAANGNMAPVTIAANGFVGLSKIEITAQDSDQGCPLISKSVTLYVGVAVEGTPENGVVATGCDEPSRNAPFRTAVATISPKLSFSTTACEFGQQSTATRQCVHNCPGCSLVRSTAWAGTPAALTGLASNVQSYFGALWHDKLKRLYLNPFVATSQHANWLYIDTAGVLQSYVKPTGIPTTASYAAYYGVAYHAHLDFMYFAPCKYFLDTTTWHYISDTGTVESYTHTLTLGGTGSPAGASYHPLLKRVYFGILDTLPNWVYIDDTGVARSYTKPDTGLAQSRGGVWMEALKRMYFVPWTAGWGTDKCGYIDATGSWTSYVVPATGIGNHGAPVSSINIHPFINGGNAYVPTLEGGDWYRLSATTGEFERFKIGGGRGSMAMVYFREAGMMITGTSQIGGAGDGTYFATIDSNETLTETVILTGVTTPAVVAYHPSLGKIFAIPNDVSTNHFSVISFE